MTVVQVYQKVRRNMKTSIEEEMKNDGPLFKNLQADDPEPEATEIESLCVECEETGTTRLLLTKIPFFKDVILMSFSCPHCGESNNEIRPAGPIQDKGIRIKTDIKDIKDINRRVVKQASASFRIPELEFESEAFSQKGVLSTVEGVIQNAIDGLAQQQTVRRIIDPETASKIDEFISKLEACQRCERDFTFIVEDITGNSFIENRFAPAEDSGTVVEYFTRSQEEDVKLGIYSEEGSMKDEDNVGEEDKHEGKDAAAQVDLQNEILQFPCNCSNCNSPAMTNMKVVQIPYFKEVVIMASNCEKCGFRSNEIKSGGGVEPYGIKLSLRMTDSSDLNRDVLKSETCYIMIPEFDFEMRSGTIGGKFTTVEGLLVSIKDELHRSNPFSFGDSAVSEEKQKMEDFFSTLDKVISGEKLVTLILDDPLGNSYIQNFYAPEPDPELQVEKYERTFEQNEQFGLNDIKTS